VGRDRSGHRASPASPGSTNYFVNAQPYLPDRQGVPMSSSIHGLPFTMLRPAPMPTFFAIESLSGCGSTAQLSGFAPPPFPFPPIVTDVDYGQLTCGDPFPGAWQRLFQYCQLTAVTLPRPKSTATDTFILANRQTTAIPTGAVTPILSAVQNPAVNGASIFQTTTLTTTSVNLTWNAPAIGQPYGYYVTVYQLGTLTNGGTEEYIAVGHYGAAKTSIQVPFLATGNTYVFLITSETDGIANMEKNPLRAKIPNGEAAVISAPITIATP